MRRFFLFYSNFYLIGTILFHNVSACTMMLGLCVCVTIVNGKTTLAGFEEQYIRLGQVLEQMTSLWLCKKKKNPGKRSDLLLWISINCLQTVWQEELL